MKKFFPIANQHDRGFIRKLSFLSIALILAGAVHSFAAGNINVNINATILSTHNCRFQSSTAALPFGNLDPANPVPVNASTTIDFRCNGANAPVFYGITQDGGLNPLGPQNRMEHLTSPGNFIPYTLSLVSPAPPINRNVWYTLTINGSILGPDYQVAPGDYEDTVVISIIP